MPIGNLNIAGRITKIHQLSLQLEASAATPGQNSRELVDLFIEIAKEANLGIVDACNEVIDNTIMALRAGRPA